MLRDGDAPVAQLAASFDMTRPAVSRHLRVLRDARLVRERRGGDDGRQRIYQLTPGPLRDVARWAEQYEVFWQDGLTRLKQHVERGARRGREERVMTHPIGDPFGASRRQAGEIDPGVDRDRGAARVVFRALADPHELVAWLGEAPMLAERDAAPPSRATRVSPAAARLARTRPCAGRNAGHRLAASSFTSSPALPRDDLVGELESVRAGRGDASSSRRSKSPACAGTRVTVTHRARSDALAPRGDERVGCTRRGGTTRMRWAALLARLAAYVAHVERARALGRGAGSDVTQASARCTVASSPFIREIPHDHLHAVRHRAVEPRRAHYDVFSRLLMDRIIFLGTAVDDDVANVIIAQLLFLEADNAGRDIHLYINSPGGSVSAGLAIYDTMQYLKRR